MERHFIAEGIFGNSHSQTQGNNIYNMKFLLIGYNEADLMICKFQTF